MAHHSHTSGEDQIAVEVARNQLQHFTDTDPRCRAVQLPEGIMLRYTLSHAMYFYLLTKVKDGNIMSKIFASDSPYDRQKTTIGEVSTPMFEPGADLKHLEKLKAMLHSWVDFIADDPDSDQDFKSFSLKD
jgi:hypothetical protein